MEQPEGLQRELLKLSRPVRKWVFELAGMVDPEESRTGCSCCDPTHDSPDPVVVRLEAEVERLRGFYAKLYGCVRGYCNADPQVRGEAYRDLEATLQYVDGYDAECGWPACYERKLREVTELRSEVDRLNTAWRAIDRANESLRGRLAVAEAAARWLCGNAIFGVNKEAIEKWPWLEGNAAKAGGRE